MAVTIASCSKCGASVLMDHDVTSVTCSLCSGDGNVDYVPVITPEVMARVQDSLAATVRELEQQ